MHCVLAMAWPGGLHSEALSGFYARAAVVLPLAWVCLPGHRFSQRPDPIPKPLPAVPGCLQGLPVRALAVVLGMGSVVFTLFPLCEIF